MTCPIHGSRLYGGPIVYQCCTSGGHTVRAADLTHDYTPKAAAS